MLSVADIPASEYPPNTSPMSETKDIEEKLRELLGERPERSPESMECAKIESAILHIAKAYSRTVAVLLNFRDTNPDTFLASYSERNRGIIRAYENIETGLKNLEEESLK